MRLPLVNLKEVAGPGPYRARLEVTLWPGLVEEVSVPRLSRQPDRAYCSRIEGLEARSYVVTLCSSGEPFASVYLCPPWIRSASGTTRQTP
ncbi:hypothetical protein ASAC_0587 [Acidilobus saccharovorans 345-15]|uniref:Uncharacterized protein n=1 Tax=Acidilobus saccharovorans (strain DSM 16705 / JCM 18335 / VKM B-2471 / 345-15) TaxID=666510 RepID=D9Q106_ACIS3|nr:hypothetical protein [Acidilobus saccharovorans]ADL18994.1 hypothetical protein ASAC_0587 [Acidilobus saccharovorans 345-15]